MYNSVKEDYQADHVFNGFILCHHIITGIKNAGTLCEYPGVWIDGQRKVAAIGIHAKHFATMHGIAINCNCDLEWFKHIVPCGIHDKEVTSISKECGRVVTLQDVLSPFISSFEETFNCQVIS